MGRAGRTVVPDGVSEAGWLRASSARTRRLAEIFTRRENRCHQDCDQTAAGGPEPDRNRAKPTAPRGRHHEPGKCHLVPGWQAFASDWCAGGTTVSVL